MSSGDAVLFIGFGGPEKSADVMPFLEIVTQGRGIPRERLRDVAHHYEAIGGASPINAITRQQAGALERQLRAQGSELRVYVGQRNWHPFLEDALRRMAKDGVKRAVGFPAAAHRCEASWERYLNAVEDARNNIGVSAPQIDYVDPWFDYPLFIEAIAERVKEALRTPSPVVGDHRSDSSLDRWPRIERSKGGGGGRDGGHSRNFIPPPSSSPTRGEEISWIFTAHSIPTPMAAASQYVQELERTAELVASRFGQTRWKLAYSSRSGRPQDPWLEPDVSDAILDAARRGVREVLLIPVGFIADHVEVLYDLDVEARQTADKAGVRLLRSQTVGDHPLFVRMMADVIQKRRSA